jgi:predicted ribonuclease YlaK
MMNNSSSAVQDEIFIVLDTNILISHQDHVKSLIADIEHRQRNVVVVVPWVVLEELDNIKVRVLDFDPKVLLIHA